MNENTPPVAAREHTVESFTREFLRELNFSQGVDLDRASDNDKYLALAKTVRHYLMTRWLETLRNQYTDQAKTVAYLSAEFLLGPQLENSMLAANLDSIAAESLRGLGIDIEELRGVEIEPGLGNGGLGRLAACFIDSLATLNVPSIGYGIRYEYGIFRQTFVDGKQVEKPDDWLRLGSPWEIAHPENAVEVHFGGHTKKAHGGAEGARAWLPDWHVMAVPYNYMVPGYRNGRVNTLRLWSAKATRAFDLQIFNEGDYEEAVRAQTFAENISKVIYPEDSTPQGKELRLQQQYFFVAASLRDFLTNVLPPDYPLENLPNRVTWQLNDTHPVIAVPELMRILIDERGWDWDKAWGITQQVFAYTCHTLLPEALEVWPTDLLGKLLPRHLEIIYQINDEFVDQVRAAYPGDELRVRRMSIVAEHPVRAVRMAHLATVAGFKVNGVAALHSKLLAEKLLVDFAQMWPEKFTNVTNGITPRRFVRLSNPGLSGLITEAIGDGWITDLDQLSRLEPLADDAEFRRRFREIKSSNKVRLAGVLAKRGDIELAGDGMVDAMVKRLHEYKRQSLKLLHIVSVYEGICSGRIPLDSVTPRTFVFGAKAAPGYVRAKETIELINAVGRTINADASLKGRLKVAFPANYNVTLAEVLIPAADLSEQISLAGKEASGTGNMKFALNGALTIGTDDGANVEIRKLVGDENFFLFGMDEPAAAALQASGYHPDEFYESDADLKAALDMIASGAFTGGDQGGAVTSIFADLTEHDRFMALADFRSYLDAQAKVEAAYADQDAWSRSAVLNVARSGFFSSDRSIRDYLDRIWKAKPIDQNA
ncbi:glycogen/starch/alpha-glucan phosphorylase [Demequina lutea]|uniref:Alpha-1,4 glucan phosphorylase n=1 Tax=Demequina lutea TaxID=431489 RepID=A0A7Z0CJX2_9MICO|nr:glycogen/starch/alpha-glucan phosphorylase [Demequina lutea]NYI41160.1 starch phosphorylase [Demequina lutea]